MKILFLLFFSFWTMVIANNDTSNEDPVFPGTTLHTLESLSYFTELVDKHKLNVSIVISHKEQKKERKFDLSIALIFPSNQVGLTESSFSQEEKDTFFELATSDRLAAQVLVFSEDANVESSITEFGSIPESRAQKFMLDMENRQRDFQWYDKNYISQYTFLTPKENGKHETSHIIYGDLDIQVIKALNFTEVEIDSTKRALANAYFVYTPNDFDDALVAMLKIIFPDLRWQVVETENDNNYIKAKKSVTLKLLDQTYLIYAI